MLLHLSFVSDLVNLSSLASFSLPDRTVSLLNVDLFTQTTNVRQDCKGEPYEQKVIHTILNTLKGVARCRAGDLIDEELFDDA